MLPRTVWTRLLAAAFALLVALGGAPANADPMTYHVVVNTTPIAGTQGSLEFQFASALGNPPGGATIADFSGGGTAVGSPYAFFGNLSGAMPPGPLAISETATQSADAGQDFNFGGPFSFDVTLSQAGSFSLLLWDTPGGVGNNLLSSPDPSAAGAALVIAFDGSGNSTVLAGPGVSVPEPSSLALLGLSAAGLLGRRLWRRRRAAALRRRAPLTVELLEDRSTPTVTFLGVAAGDASSNDAILWTRAQDSGTANGVPVQVLVSASQSLGSGVVFSGTTDPTQDYTIHIDATGLQSNTTYYYQFMTTGGSPVFSQEGTFKTAPAPTAAAAVHFGFTGDADGLLRPYDATSSFTTGGVPSFAQQNFDYFVWLGDTIYETASGGTGPNASPAVPSSSVAANINSPAALQTMLQAYWTKYKQQLMLVSTGPYPGLGDNTSGLQGFFDSTGHYTLLDNHELGNQQAINGGAPAGSSPAGIGVSASNPAFDVNTTGAYMNQSPIFKTLMQAYTDYQPIRVQTVSAPGDPRSNGTQQLYFEQQWGANAVFFNLDDRSYRDIRMKTSGGADDTGPRADNPARTMLGATQLAWVENSLLAAQQQGVTWKFVAVSSPIDQIGPIGGSFTINNSGDPNTTQPGYTNTESDGGKSWMGEYRPERNALLKFIADNHIDHVVFLTTDDHQVRINELGYFTQFTTDSLGYQTPVQSSYTRVPGAFQILVGPIGATGPDAITDHSIANIQALAQSFAGQQQALGLDPIGLDPNFPGLQSVSRFGDPNANANRSVFDFYSPDTFNYASLNVDSTGQHLTVTIDGQNSYAQNSFPQPSSANPVYQIMQFTVGLDAVNVSVSQATATSGGTTTLSATLTDTTGPGPLANRTLVFSVNGKVLGTATTNAGGVATLPNVSIAGLGLLPGVNAGAVSVRYLGDTTTLNGTGTAAMVIQPAGNVSGQVSFGRTGPVYSRANHTSTVGLIVTNLPTSPTLNGNFAVRVTNVTPGVTFQSASMLFQGQTINLVVTHDMAGNAFVNLPAFITRLGGGQSLPTIALVFGNANNLRFNFTTDLFADPAGG